MKFIELEASLVSNVVKESKKELKARIAYIKSLGAKSTEGFYVRDGKARSIIDG